MKVVNEEFCPHCDAIVEMDIDTEVLDAVIRGEHPDWEPTYCPECENALRPCGYCYEDGRDCLHCPFDWHYANKVLNK